MLPLKEALDFRQSETRLSLHRFNFRDPRAQLYLLC